jgi:hypothetical protein
MRHGRDTAVSFFVLNLGAKTMTGDDELSTERAQAFAEKRTYFYAMVGHCILRFQHVEDYLEDVFAVVLGGKKDRADAVFASVRGVDRKIQIISTAATGLAGPPWDDLSSLLVRVKEASDMRGQIAHANPVQHGGLIHVRVRTENGQITESLGVERIEEGRWELHKRAKQTTVFTIEDLQRGYDRMDKLFLDVIAFVKLAGQNQQA